MSKTTRELAELFGVSKQAIEKKYTPEFKAKYMSKVTTNGVPTWLVADEGVNVLKSVFLGTNGVPTDDKIFRVLEEQIKSQKNQIESLQKLLDQSQQLLLSEQKKSQSLIESKQLTVKFDDYLAEQLKDDDFKQGFLKEKEKLDKQVERYRSESLKNLHKAEENKRRNAKTEKALWFVVAFAGILFILLLILTWLYIIQKTY